jgi:HEAT repeat protein
VGEIAAREGLVVLIPLLGDATPVVRRRVEEILARQGREVGQEITTYLESTPSRAGRRAAVDLLGWLRVPEAADVLLELLDDPDLEIRVKAAKAAGGIGDPRFLDILHGRLDDPAWEVRCQAARALTTLGSATSVPRLRAALRDRHWWVRFYAASALVELGMAGLAALQDALEDPVPAARDMARYLLDRTGGVPALP